MNGDVGPARLARPPGAHRRPSAIDFEGHPATGPNHGSAVLEQSRDGVEAMLRSFSQDDRDHMVENGEISVTCEFCSANYRFAPGDVRPDTPGESGEPKPEEKSKENTKP